MRFVGDVRFYLTGAKQTRPTKAARRKPQSCTTDDPLLIRTEADPLETGNCTVNLGGQKFVKYVL